MLCFCVGREMFEEILEKAIDTGASRIEIEYKDGAELVSAFRGQVGIGIAWLDDTQTDIVFDEMRKMKKRKTITLREATYCLAFSKYESFGEWVYVVEIKAEKSELIIQAER